MCTRHDGSVRPASDWLLWRVRWLVGEMAEKSTTTPQHLYYANQPSAAYISSFWSHETEQARPSNINHIPKTRAHDIVLHQVLPVGLSGRSAHHPSLLRQPHVEVTNTCHGVDLATKTQPRIEVHLVTGLSITW